MVEHELEFMTDRAQMPLDLGTKLAYGLGEWGGEVPGSLQVFYVLFFLTTVAGLSPGTASSVLAIGKLWDAFNDPIVGWLSDRTCSVRWGRRYPWMLWGAVPLGLSFALQWWVPPGLGSRGLQIYYAAVIIVYYVAFTMVRVPYATLVAELTEGYDERTSLVSFKASFAIGGSILTLLIARVVLGTAASPGQQFPLLGAICGTISIATVYISIWGTYRRYWSVQTHRRSNATSASSSRSTTSLWLQLRLSLWGQFRTALSCSPFRFTLGIYLCSWVGLQLPAAVLPYFTVSWMGLDESRSATMLLAVQGTAMVAMAFWSWLGRKRLGKRAIYCWGMPLPIVALAGLFFLAPGQEGLMYALGAVAGVGLATAYLVPWSMLPDVIDADELQTGERREGVFYSLVVQLQKFGSVLAIFGVGMVLDWSGFITATAGEAIAQPPLALLAVRALVGLVPAVILLGGLAIAAFYPITREVHAEILTRLVVQRQQEQTTPIRQIN